MSKGGWKRVTKRRPCPVCQHESWCVYVGRDEMPEAALCQRVESPRRIGEAGWLHRLGESATAWPGWGQTLRHAVRIATDMRPPSVASLIDDPGLGRMQEPGDFERICLEAASPSLRETKDRL